MFAKSMSINDSLSDSSSDDSLSEIELVTAACEDVESESSEAGTSESALVSLENCGGVGSS